MKKYLPACLLTAALLIALTCAACAEPAKCPYDIHLSIMYNNLSRKEKTLYDRLYDAIREGKTTVQVPSGMKYDDVHWLLDDIGNESAELCAFDYWNTKIITKSAKVTEIHLGYKMSVSEQDTFIRDTKNLAKQFAGKSDKDGIRAIHDYLIRQFEYGDGSDPTLQAYYALKTRKAVCNGYAQAFALLCHFAGYSCSYIDGDVVNNRGETTGRHAWNVTLIDTRFSWTDTTWDDAGTRANTTWFDKTGKQMKKSHRPDPEYKSFETKASILKDKVTFTMYLDLYDQNGYVKGVTDKTGKSFSKNALKKGQYYAPAVVIWNNSAKSYPVTVSHSLNGKAVHVWDKCSVDAKSNLAFRITDQTLRGKTGTQKITWYVNGYVLGTFTWKIN